jgi:hypothetical protein
MKKEDIKGSWRELHNEGLHTSHFSPNIIRMIKSRRIWVGHIAYIEHFR